MGIIKATASAIQGAASDQWKEAFVAGEMGRDVLMVRAKQIAGSRGSNTPGSSVITDGSVIIVGEGECAIASEGGKIIGVYDQPGEQIYRSSNSKGFFGGGLGAFARDVGRRISFGGDVAISQRLYYINTKELDGGTIRAACVPLRYKDSASGLDIDGGVSCYGSYTFRIADPEKFFTAAIRTPGGRYRRELLQQMDSELVTALTPALAQLTREGIRPSELANHTADLCKQLRQIMSDQWSGLRGIEVFSVALETVRVLDSAMIRTMQRDSAFTDPTRAAAYLTGAQGQAMQAAANNQSGAPAAVLGMVGASPDPRRKWLCKCGHVNEGNFCTECGTKRPTI